MSPRRNPTATRQRLLWAAFREFHRQGFRAADLGRILKRAEVTKGALYYHFPSKKSLGYAVIDELLGNWILERWLRPLQTTTDPLAGLSELARWGERTANPEGLGLGCPLHNLSQELSGLDEGFRQRLARVYESWHSGLSEVLASAQRRGEIRRDVDTETAAAFIIAVWEGSIGLAKPYRGSEVLRQCRLGLEAFLGTLRPESSRSEVAE